MPWRTSKLSGRDSGSTPTPDQLATWQSYDARLTAYSNKDADWPYPTAAAPNWEGTSWNGDPGAVEGTTVAVDFNRIPRGSLIYIPALDMFAEANDTGATGLWSASDSGQLDYGSNGLGESMFIIGQAIARRVRSKRASRTRLATANMEQSMSSTAAPDGRRPRSSG